MKKAKSTKAIDITTMQPVKLKSSKKEKGLESSPEYADYPKTVIAAAVDAAVEEVAESGTAEIRKAEPRTAPRRRTIIIPIFYPSTAIRRRTVIVIVPSIGAPFPDIAVHVIQAPGIGREAGYTGGLSCSCKK